MLRFFLIIITMTVFTGCNGTQTFSAPVFESTADAKVMVLSAPNEVLPLSLWLNASDSLLTVAGELDGKGFHTYDRKTGKAIGHYVNIGQGPDDMIYSGRFFQDNEGVTAQDMATQAIKRYDKKWKCLSTEVPDFSKMGKYSPRDVRPMPDGKVFIEVFVDNYMPLGLQIKDGDRYGNVYTDLPVIVDDPMTGKPVYDRKINFSPDTRKMVAASGEGLILEIFDIENLEINPRALQLYYPFELERKANGIAYKESNIKGIEAITSTNNRIVAVYNESCDRDAYNDISVWDWEGRSLRRYHTDKILLAIALSPDNPDEIYALGSDKGGEVELLLINCPGLLD